MSKFTILVVLCLIGSDATSITTQKIEFEITIQNFTGDGGPAGGNSYVLTKDSLKVYYPFYFVGESENELFFKKGRKLSERESLQLGDFAQNMKLDSMCDSYRTYGITDLRELYIRIAVGKRIKDIYVYAYYHPQIALLIKEVNEVLSKEDNIHYNKEYLEKIMNRLTLIKEKEPCW